MAIDQDVIQVKVVIESPKGKLEFYGPARKMKEYIETSNLKDYVEAILDFNNLMPAAPPPGAWW